MRNFSRTIDYSDIGLRIKSLRRKHKISQEKLAEAVGLSISHISHIENASTKISLPTLVAIANYFQVLLDYLLCGSLKESHDTYYTQIDFLLKQCNPTELRIIWDTVSFLSQSLHKHYPPKEDY